MASSRIRTSLFEDHTVVVATVILVAVSLLGCGSPAMAFREPLLIADFVNTTDDAVFDGALKDALDIQLRQSPYLNVLPAAQVSTALRSMGRPPNERVTATLARDVCQRMGAKAILLGSIAPQGAAYVIGLEAQGCESGDSLVREEAQAASKTAVLAAMSSAAARLRERLGESLPSIERFNVPAQNATTPSLDALKAYSSGLEMRAKSGDADAIPLFQRALELDEHFALAAARLGAIYANLHDAQQAQHYMKQAYSASEALSEPERLFIKADYNDVVTGRLDEVIGTYQLWAQTYPQDWIPHNNLSAAYYRANRMEEALTEARVAVELAPAQVVAYQQLARTLVAMDRAADATSAVREAEQKGLDSSFNRALMYRLAFFARDMASMDQQLQAAATRADGYLVVAEAARAAAASGAFETSRALFGQAIDAAQGANLTDYAGSLTAEQGVYAALLGDQQAGRRDMFAAVDISNGPDTLWMASLAASFSGLATEAMQLAVGYAQGMPPAPDVVATLRPILEAGVALAQKDPKTAIDALNRADPFARAADPWVPYLRGLAYLAQKDSAQAMIQFRAAVEHLEHQPVTLVHPLAHLQVARMLRDANDAAGARAEYANVLAAWKDADAGHPFVAAARREAASLR